MRYELRRHPKRSRIFNATVMTMNWHVYIIRCTDNTLYTGITLDVVRRFKQHSDHQGAKYFRGRGPKQLVYVETGHDRSSAGKRENHIKKLPRVEKLQLLVSDTNQVGTFIVEHSEGIAVEA